MEWKDLDMIKLDHLREAISDRIKEYESDFQVVVSCSLCKIYDTDSMVPGCQGCPANIKVCSPKDRRKKESICDIYCGVHSEETILKFLKEQRDRIDIEIKNLMEEEK